MKVDFNPTQLGNLEVSWWRAHHEKDKTKMAQLLTEQNIVLYGFSEEEAKSALLDLINGVKNHDTRNWNQAIESVTSYYEKVKIKTHLTFNPKEMAILEVGWWQLHDELEFNPDKSKLALAFAKLYAAQFETSVESMMAAGKLKAAATKEHDLAEDPNTSTTEVGNHWGAAKQHLIDFYAELKRVLSDKYSTTKQP